MIPESVTSIDDYAFHFCRSLTNIVIPEGVTSIGNYVFAGCSSLTSIVVDNNNDYFDSRNNCNAIIETKSNTLIQGCASSIIPANVTSIGEGAFFSCNSLKSIVIPDGVKAIGSEAFCKSGLTSIVIPDGVTSLGSNAFAYCYGLTSIEIPDSVISIGIGAFQSCI